MRVGTMIALAAGVAIVYVAATRRSSGGVSGMGAARRRRPRHRSPATDPGVWTAPAWTPGFDPSNPDMVWAPPGGTPTGITTPQRGWQHPRTGGAEPRPIAISDARRWLEGRRR